MCNNKRRRVLSNCQILNLLFTSNWRGIVLIMKSESSFESSMFEKHSVDVTSLSKKHSGPWIESVQASNNSVLDLVNQLSNNQHGSSFVFVNDSPYIIVGLCQNNILRMIVGCIVLCISVGIYRVQESWETRHLWIHMTAYNT
jgi:hypothetical protein